MGLILTTTFHFNQQPNRTMTEQLTLPATSPEEIQRAAKRLKFASITGKDYAELTESMQRIFALMSDQEWHTAEEIIAVSGQREGLRRMRDLRHHGYKVECERANTETREFKYRLCQ